MRDQRTRRGFGGLSGIGGITMLVLAGCGDLGANPAVNEPIESGGAGGVGGGAGGAGGSSGGGQACPPSVPAGSIKALLQESCTACHGVQLLGGAPMPLVTFEDLHRPSVSNPSKKVYELLVPMMTNAAEPMPPEGQLPAADIALVNSWVQAGAPACGFNSAPPGVGGSSGQGGSGQGGSGQGGSGQGGVGGSGEGGVGGSGEGGVGGSGEGGVGGVGGAGGSGNLPPNTQCYEFRAHQNQTPGDTAPYMVGLGPFLTSPGQFYQNFIFKVPWTQKVTAVRSEPVIDNGAIVHHWLLFQVRRNHSAYRDGTHTTVLGQHPDSELVTGWAPGGNTIDMPAGVGMEVPDPGGLFELEIHYNNPQGGNKPDRSGVRLCVTTEPMPNVATLTWLGTENINIPARSIGTAQATCNPSNPQGGDIHILQSIPHMHKIGAHMKTVVNRKAGGQEILIDKPFKFDEQRQYDTPFTLKAGDTLTTTCTFNNTTNAPVAFGTVSEAEMCYNFVVAYPARALHKPGNSIEGAMNTCLW